MTDQKHSPRASRYPGYDVLRKRHTPSWDETTRRVVDARLATRREPAFLDDAAWRTLDALCARVVPQPADRLPVAVAALVDARLQHDQGDGYRDARLPPTRAAWQRGLAALDAEAQARYNVLFHRLDCGEQDALITKMQTGELTDAAWRDMPPQLFFADRVLHDICGAYYSHPASWSEIGFGGPASPRGVASGVGVRWINCYKRVNPGSPFGGVGKSGYGREMGFEAMPDYTEARSVWVNVDGNVPPHFTR